MYPRANKWMCSRTFFYLNIILFVHRRLLSDLRNTRWGWRFADISNPLRILSRDFIQASGATGFNTGQANETRAGKWKKLTQRIFFIWNGAVMNLRKFLTQDWLISFPRGYKTRATSFNISNFFRTRGEYGENTGKKLMYKKIWIKKLSWKFFLGMIGAVPRRI